MIDCLFTIVMGLLIAFTLGNIMTIKPYRRYSCNHCNENPNRRGPAISLISVDGICKQCGNEMEEVNE